MYEYTFLQGRYTNDQESHEKIIKMTTNQGNENKNQNEISPHTSIRSVIK